MTLSFTKLSYVFKFDPHEKPWFSISSGLKTLKSVFEKLRFLNGLYYPRPDLTVEVIY